MYNVLSKAERPIGQNQGEGQDRTEGTEGRKEGRKEAAVVHTGGKGQQDRRERRTEGGRKKEKGEMKQENQHRAKPKFYSRLCVL